MYDNQRILIELLEQKKMAEERVKQLKEQISAVSDRIVDEYVEHGIKSVKVDGLNIGLRQQLFASLDAETCDGMTLEGLETFLSACGIHNVVVKRADQRKLTSAIKEIASIADDGKVTLPDGLDSLVNVFVKNKIAVTKGGSK